MRIKITLVNPNEEQIFGEYSVANNIYIGTSKYCGYITEIQEDDDWVDNEVGWISKSELHFVTAIRHTLMTNDLSIPHIVGCTTPLISPTGHGSIIREVALFPDSIQSTLLLQRLADDISVGNYGQRHEELDIVELSDKFNRHISLNSLLARASASLLKSHILMQASFNTFAEETYINLFRGLEAIVEYFRQERQLPKREDAVAKMAEIIGSLAPGMSFVEYEEEMRDVIRNDIIHPYRDRERRIVENPHITADYIFEDLSFVDGIFKIFVDAKLPGL